jgi:hypothetical protein
LRYDAAENTPSAALLRFSRRCDVLQVRLAPPESRASHVGILSGIRFQRLLQLDQI